MRREAHPAPGFGALCLSTAARRCILPWSISWTRTDNSLWCVNLDNNRTIKSCHCLMRYRTGCLCRVPRPRTVDHPFLMKNVFFHLPCGKDGPNTAREIEQKHSEIRLRRILQDTNTASRHKLTEMIPCPSPAHLCTRMCVWRRRSTSSPL